MGMINRYTWLLVGWLLCTDAWGQALRERYLVVLTDKAGTPYRIDRPEQFLSARAITRRQTQRIPVTERDLPVSPAYVAQLQQAGATVSYTSRWLNAVLIEATEPVLTAVRALPFVSGIDLNRPLGPSRPRTPGLTAPASATTTPAPLPATPDYGVSLEQLAQLGADQMHAQGFRGEGKLIAVFDEGFRNANQVAFLRPLFADNRVVATYDFVDREVSVYEDGSHGMEVLSLMAATADGRLYGTAYKASYILLRTEDDQERPIEEANWLLAAEYADSAGVDVINSSLGYFDFDPPYPDYTTAQLDGRTTLISRAAAWAAEAGMVVVVSAGNSGNTATPGVSAPADAAPALAVGAINRQGLRASFSSVGPSADGRIKPDVVALGSGTVLGGPDGRITTGNGTSYSAPLVAGLAAGVWQANPQFTAAQVTDYLRRSGSQFSTPDNNLGYGIPNFSRPLAVPPDEALHVYPNPFTSADQLTITWTWPGAPVQATLTDLTGRVLQQTLVNAGTASRYTPPPTLPPGLYHLTLTAGTQRRRLKLLKI